MNEMHCNSNIEKNVSTPTNLIVDILNTRELRGMAAGVGHEILERWSSQNRLKKRIGNTATHVLEKFLESGGHQKIKELSERPEFAEALAIQIPGIISQISEIGLSMARAIETLPDDRKKTLADRILAGFSGASPGSILNSAARTLASIYRDDPLFFSSRLVPVIERVVSHTDFGELKDLFDSAKTDIGALLTGSAGVLFDNPAKLISLLSASPDLLNLAVTVGADLFEHINALPPDIFTDLLLSLLKEADAAAIGQCLNRINEAIRQIHTGSSLIGEMDAPRFTADLKDKIRDILAEIDPTQIGRASCRERVS
jgi:hypothetical protein